MEMGERILLSISDQFVCISWRLLGQLGWSLIVDAKELGAESKIPGKERYTGFEDAR